MKTVLIIFCSILLGGLISSCNNESSLININDDSDIESITLEEKIYGLSLIWKEAEYNFVFWDKLNSLDWDNAYSEALLRVINTKDTREYYLELMRFAALLRDGHTGVWLPNELQIKYGELPFRANYVDGKHVITNTDVNFKDAHYSEILEINGLPTQQYIEEKIFPYMWHEKFDSAYNQIFRLVPIIEAGNEIELKTDRGVFKIKPVTEKINWLKTYSFHNSEDLTWIVTSNILRVGITNDNIAVITIPTFADNNLPEQFYEILPKIKNCQGFLIDVRQNPGGSSSNAYAVAQAFIKGKFESSRAKMPIHNGTYKAWGRTYRFLNEETHITHIPQCPAFIDAPVVILESHATGSAAEDFLVVFDNINRATIVGTASVGSTGQPLLNKLPGGGNFRICTRWCLYPNGKEFINIGVTPHVYAAMSLDDLKNDFDSVFETGMKVLRKQIDK